MRQPMWKETLQAIGQTTVPVFSDALTLDDIKNGILRVGNFVATGQDLYLVPTRTLFKKNPPEKAFQANKLYQVIRMDPDLGLAGFTLNVDGVLRSVYFAKDAKDEGWAELFYRALPSHPEVSKSPVLSHPGGPTDLPKDILDLLNVTYKGTPSPIDKIVKDELATFSPTTAKDIPVFRMHIGQALMYLQNTGKIVIDDTDGLVYLTREGRV